MTYHRYSLEESFEKLCDVLDYNRTSSRKDLWAVYFHWWRYFYCFNESLQILNKLNDKVSLIEKFMKYNQELLDLGDFILKDKKLKQEDVPPIESFTFAPHIQNVRNLMKNEQNRSAKLIQETKKQKMGKYPKKLGGQKQKWLKS